MYSATACNGKTGLMVCCRMRTRINGHPFEVLTQVDRIASAIPSDQVQSLDWNVCHAQKKGTVPGVFMSHVRAKIKALLVIP
jgi:mRNA interferase MazF